MTLTWRINDVFTGEILEEIPLYAAIGVLCKIKPGHFKNAINIFLIYIPLNKTNFIEVTYRKSDSFCKGIEFGSSKISLSPSIYH